MAPRSDAPPPDVGQFVRGLRRRRNLTLEELAQRSGVSKSMLSQIERNRTNPTLATVWRLCESLGIGIDALFGDESDASAVELVAAHATPAIRSGDGKCILRILGPLDLAGRIEWYEMEAEPGAVLESDAHNSGAVEHLTVLEGSFTVECGDGARKAGKGETVRYRADLPHTIRNDGDGPARALLVDILRRPGAD